MGERSLSFADDRNGFVAFHQLSVPLRAFETSFRIRGVHFQLAADVYEIVRNGEALFRFKIDQFRGTGKVEPVRA